MSFFFSGSNADGISMENSHIRFIKCSTDNFNGIPPHSEPLASGHCKVPHLGSMEKLLTFSTMRSSVADLWRLASQEPRKSPAKKRSIETHVFYAALLALTQVWLGLGWILEQWARGISTKFAGCLGWCLWQLRWLPGRIGNIWKHMKTRVEWRVWVGGKGQRDICEYRYEDSYDIIYNVLYTYILYNT